MTDLPYTYWCNYLTEQCEWRQIDWDSRIIVKGVKGDPYDGYLSVKIKGAYRQFYAKDIGEFVDILLPALGKHLGADIKGPISIVPIPSSQMAEGAAGPFRIVELAEKVAAGYGPEAKVVPALLWDAPRNKAHLSKQYRTPDLFEPHLRLGDHPKAPVVLFDDVLTSGSQMIAAARMLRKNGVNAVRGLVVARATKEQKDDVCLRKREDKLELDPKPIDFKF